MVKNLLRRLLPAPVRALLGRTHATVVRVWPTLCYRSGLLQLAGATQFGASLYYAFFSRAFGREHQAVLRGRLAYYRSLRASEGSAYLLRRNIHRMEKGLIMSPRREVFAVDYVAETVDAFADALPRDDGAWIGSPEFHWARDVLTMYFEKTSSHPVLDLHRERFRELTTSLGISGEHCPGRRDLSGNPPVTWEAFSALSKRRRSVRWFLDRPVPRELLNKAVMPALQSPSACNRQPFTFRVFDEPNAVQQVANLPMGTVGFNHNFPAIVVLVGTLEAYPSERDRHIIYIDAALSAMTFMFALETLGLSSCPINWPDIHWREEQMQHHLGLRVHERPILLIAVGYPDPEGLVPYSGKKDIHEMVRYGA